MPMGKPYDHDLQIMLGKLHIDLLQFTEGQTVDFMGIIVMVIVNGDLIIDCINAIWTWDMGFK